MCCFFVGKAEAEEIVLSGKFASKLDRAMGLPRVPQIVSRKFVPQSYPLIYAVSFSALRCLSALCDWDFLVCTTGVAAIVVALSSQFDFLFVASGTVLATLAGGNLD